MTPFLQWIVHYKYLALLPVAIVEGPVLSTSIGFLIHLGYVSYLPSLGIFILADFIPETFYYYWGSRSDEHVFREKYASKIRLISANFDLMKRLWRDHPRKTMFLMKISYGFSIPFLFAAGLFKVPYRKFISIAMVMSTIQYAFFLALGFYLGESYEIVGRYIRNGSIAISILIILALIIYLLSTRFAKREFERLEAEEMAGEPK